MESNMNSCGISEELEKESDILEAEIIYVVLRKACYVSRSLRIQWFLQHLNSSVRISRREIEDDDSEETIISIIPQEPPKDWTVENAHLYEYVVSLSTNVIFLGGVYRQVYCLDISPSVSTVDIQQGEVLLDLIIEALQQSIKCLIKPFTIPGSSHLFQPDIFITVIAHTPFYISPAQQVLVQGWKISERNLNEFLEAVLRQLEFVENAVAQVSGAIHEQFDRERKKSLTEQIELKKSTERLFKDDHDISFTPSSPNIAMVSPGSGFLNLLRYGMLALKLLPISNFSNLVVITDGMIIMPDTDTLDSVLNHMRYNDIACYFLHVGSQFHPHCGFGFVSYSEIMQLISVATNGVYLQFPPQHKQIGGLNVYQLNFLMWSLKRKSVVLDLSASHPREGEWNISNRHFCGNRSSQLLAKKYLESDINVTLYGVLACRIREGFILKNIFTRESELVINFILPWTNHIYIEYTLSCQWPLVATPAISTHYIINIKAPYEFLHDISCRMRVPIKSPFRQALIARFWRSLKSFAQSDLLLSHLESFMNNISSYYLPEILKNGIPLYQLTPGSCQPNVGSSDVGFTQFATIWRPACLLNNNLWQKWFHADRVGIIFKHDEPLNLFAPNQNATITCAGMQCRQATNTLFNFLKSFCSFVLIENHSFIKFLLPNESGTGMHSFVVIRSIFKPPYAVIHIAFLYNIPGRVRTDFLKDFKRSISALKIPRISLQKDSYDIIFGSFSSQSNCSIFLDKPLEKILIRYEQMPKDFKTVVFPDGTQPSTKSLNALSANRGLITTLSRYLHHRRWIWKTGVENRIFLPTGALKTVLSTLVKIRLQEGFYFAHCSAGICNLVLEVQMKGSAKHKEDTDGIYYDCHNETDDNEEVHSCIIQYVIFSPKTLVLDKEDDENENDVKTVELVSECWIEPQHGVITGCPSIRNYMSNLQYHQLPDALWSVDAKCISALFTFEYLRLMCEDTNIEIPKSTKNLLSQLKSSEYWPNVAPFTDQRISQISFPYSLPNLLCQCVQEILQFNLFSIDILDKCDASSESNKLLLDSIHNYLSSANTKQLVICGQDAQYFIKNFRRNFRRSDKGHTSACSMFHTSGSQQSLSSTSEKFGIIPTSHDWDRMTSWALDDSDLASGLRSSTHYNRIEPKPETYPSEFAESLHSSNFDISSVSNLENADWLKWKCYIKFTSSRTFCLITVIPDSLDVIKRLILDHKNGGQAVSESIYFDVESRVDIDDMRSSANVRNNSCSYYTSCSTSSNDLEEQDESIDKTTSNTFRLRASTWDTMRRVIDSQGNVIDRLRTNSLGARIKPLTRLRPKRSFDLDSREKLSENVMQLSKYLPLILPVYVCKCPLTDVINYLIYKNECSQCENNLKNSQKVNFDNDYVMAENHFKDQCSNISEMFTKFFILSLFKCLHQGFDIPENDIEQAFNKCDTSILTIDITDYLKIVCKHLRNISTNINENEKDVKPSSYFLSSGACNELKFIHRLIKKKFINILTTNFKPINSKPESYCFFPSWTKESKPSSVGMLSPGFAENTSMILQEQMMPVPPENISGMSTWETCKESVNSEDNACTSLISNMDSDSLNEASNESFIDDLNPLFLKMDCNIFSSNNVAKCSVNVIPTCVCEILKQVDKSFDLNMADLRITLDLVCLTSPYVEVKQKMPKQGFSQSSPKMYLPDDFCKSTTESLTDYVSFEDGHVPKQIAQLPDYQYNALYSCIAQLKWLMKDEIVAFMLDTSPITSDTLKMVCDHIQCSSNPSTCSMEEVPLSFVFGKETASINNFLQDFDYIKIPNYRLKKEKNMYYLIKDYSDRMRTFRKKEFEDPDFPGDVGRIMTTNMEVLNEEQENFFQVFSSDESIFKTESTGSASFDFTRHGSITDGDEDNIRAMQSTMQYILDRELSDAELPNFWLIMTVAGDYVFVYFHCRFLEIKKKEIEDYIIVRDTVIRNIKNLCKAVNQRMLLDNLHETRICNQLLIPDPQQDDNDNELNYMIAESMPTFIPGYFACDVVWETKFILHPRLKMSSMKGTVSRGIQALCSALSGFSVTNRKNLFVYKDVNKNVFYLKLYESIHGCTRSHESEETSSGSFSRSSSFTSLSKKQFDEQLPFLLDESRSRNKSLSDTSDSNLLRMEDFITLKVYGITESGNDIKNDLVQVLQNRLDDAVLDVISVMLSRNSLCKLLSEDVHFIQKPNQLPSCELQFYVHDWVTKYLYSFRYLVKQNVQLTACLPKYSDSRSSFHFQDYSVPEDSSRRIGEQDIFLYNQNPTSGKGIACLAYTIVDVNGDTVECTDEYDLNTKNIVINVPTLEELKIMADTHIVDRQNFDKDCNIRIEFRIWKQGKINMEILEAKLCSAIKNALWELLMEKNLLQYPVFVSDSVNLFDPFYNLIPSWMHFGTEIGVPTVRFWEISLPIRSNLNIILKELNSLFLPYEMTSYVFYKENTVYEEDSKKDTYRPHIHFDEIMQHTDDICLVIGHNLLFVNENNDIRTVISERNKSDKMIQRLPSISQEDAQSISKQKFILVLISNSKLKMYIYNYTKDKFEALTKHMTNLSEWLQARNCLLFSIVEQKMGLFYNLPIYRTNLPKKISEMTTSNLDVLLKFPVSFHKSNSGLRLSDIGNAFRDKKLSKISRDSDISQDKNLFELNVNQLCETQKVDRKVQHKYVCGVHQSKASSSINEEMLNNFSLHGRLIHYCLTPLLFMPSWRVKAAATRDHSLSLKTQSETEELMVDDQDEKWHATICSNFINEYKQYLQSMGFFSIRRSSEQLSKKSSIFEGPFEIEKKDIRYMQKNLRGGILLYELSFSEPFFNAKLYALEYARLNKKNNSAMSQFTVNFLDECDRIKFQMHLHSFTYDYHLRCLHQFISDEKPLLRHGYHMIDFLDDFMKYYSKAPNYARSLVHTECISVNDVTILPQQLFNYLLTHGKNYNMDAFCMMPQYSSSDIAEEKEYVLVRSKSTSAVYYKDVNDVQQSEDFDINIIISHINDNQEKTIKFQVYILITSRRELYLKLESEQKLGKFRTVCNSYDYISSNEDDIEMKFSIYDDPGLSKDSQDLKEKKKKFTHHVEIKQEFVNYLGYYSSHEEAMQNLMMDEVEEAKRYIEWMVTQGAFDCETHLLWNKLLCSSPSPLTYQELQHLLSLADVHEISSMDTQLKNILNQPLSWVQSFIRVLMSKLPECCHLFSSGNTQELLILHPQFSNGFVMIILNFQKSTCIINLVCRKSLSNGEEAQFELKTLFEQIINTYCFHLWLDAF